MKLIAPPLALMIAILGSSVLGRQSFNKLVQEAVCRSKCGHGYGYSECRVACNSEEQRNISVRTGEAGAHVTYMCSAQDLLVLRLTRGIYVVEYRNESSDWVALGIYDTFATRQTYHFYPPTNGRYRLRFTRALADGIAEPEITEWYTIGGLDVNLSKPWNIWVQCLWIDTPGRSPNHLSIVAQIRFIPPEVHYCSYEFICSNDEGGYKETNSIYFNQVKPAETTFINLSFDKNYTVRVYPLGGLTEGETIYSTKFIIFRNWPFPHGGKICVPEKVEGLSATAHHNGENIYDVDVTWHSLDNIPSFFIVNITSDGTESIGSREHLHNVSGDSIITTFEGVEISQQYNVSIMAWSYIVGAGPTTSKRFEISYEMIGSSVPDSDTTTSATVPDSDITTIGKVAVLACVNLVVVAGVCVYLVCRRRQRRQERRKFSEIEDNEIIPDRLVTTRVLGSGAFGVVKLGKLRDDKGQDTDVAVKMLRDNTNESELRHFRIEIEMMKSIGTHPNIVSLLGYRTVGLYPFLVVEYCPRGDLLTFLRAVFLGTTTTAADEEDEPRASRPEIADRSTTLQENSEESPETPSLDVGEYISVGVADRDATVTVLDMMNFGRQIAFGMEFLSSKRIVHRDLAARNILVCDDRVLKISDFGLSRDVYLEDMYRKTGNGRMPLKWMAIESLSHQVYTTHSDVWSFGILLWEIFTLGGTPYPGVPTIELLKRLQSGYRMERPENCSEALYNVMLACWKTKPKNRPTFTFLREELDKLISVAADCEYLDVNDVSVDIPLEEEDPKTSSTRDTPFPPHVGFVNDEEPRIVLQVFE